MEKMTVIGNLGVGDTEDGQRFVTRRATSGEVFACGSIATHYGAGANKQTTWWSFSCWGRVAENFVRYCAKGRKVYAEGVPSQYTAYVDERGKHWVDGVSTGTKVPITRFGLKVYKFEYLDAAPVAPAQARAQVAEIMAQGQALGERDVAEARQ